MRTDFPTVPPDHWRLAREMRKEPTPAEAALWLVLHRNPFDVRFRRQHPVGPCIVDFACISYKLVIEVDGPVHDEKECSEHDAVREQYLKERGLRVLRFKNDEVLTNLEGVMQKIKEALVLK